MKFPVELLNSNDYCSKPKIHFPNLIFYFDLKNINEISIVNIFEKIRNSKLLIGCMKLPKMVKEKSNLI